MRTNRIKLNDGIYTRELIRSDVRYRNHRITAVHDVPDDLSRIDLGFRVWFALAGSRRTRRTWCEGYIIRTITVLHDLSNQITR
jgi:hypothetical protein